MFGVMFGYKCLSFDAKSMPERLLGNGIKIPFSKTMYLFLLFLWYFSRQKDLYLHILFNPTKNIYK